MAYKSELLSFYETFGENREAELARVSSIILNRGTAIIAAPAGLGKSFVARRLAAAVTAQGRSVETITCVRLRDGQVLDGQVSTAGLLIVEDAQLLGCDDIARLTDLALDPNRSVLITLDSGLSCTTARFEDSRRELTTLWTERGVTRVDLSGVGYDEAVRIVEAVGGPNRIDIVTRARLIILAEGNPRLLEELTREELHRGTYSARQQNLMLGPSYMSPRIIDFVRPRLQTMEVDEEYALVTLARLGATPFARAARLVGTSPLRSLLRRGLVSYDPRTPDCVSSSALFASAALAIQTEENPFEARHVTELLLLEDLSAGIELSSAECAFVAEYLVNDPSYDPLDDMSAAEAALLLARAARHANENGMPGSARMFAHRSLGYAPTILGAEQLSRCLAQQGKIAEALAILERLAVPHTDSREDADYLTWWMQVLTRHGRSAEHMERLEASARSWGTVDSVLEEWRAFTDARSSMMLSHNTHGVAEMESIAESPSSSAPFRLRALTELLPCYVYLGETQKFEWALESGWKMIARTLATHAHVRHLDRVGISTEFIAQASIVRAAIGHDRGGLAREMESFALRTADTDDDFGMSLVNLAAGHLALEQGQGRRAEKELWHALDRVGHGTQTKWTTWMQILRANALATQGRYDEALLAEREVSTIARESSPWLAQYSQYLGARMKAYEGDAQGSVAACREIGSAGTAESRFFAVRALHVAAALGDDPQSIVAEIDSLPAQGVCESTHLLDEQLRAMAAGDGPRLVAIGDRLTALQFWWEATFAYATAASIHAAAGEEKLRAASLSRIEPLRPFIEETLERHVGSETHTVTNPASDAEREASDASSARLALLTRREREVATLAAEGMSNAEIAARLYLSVRTVESHILQARSKLGDVRRSELASIVSR